ncbi:MAG: helix-turn-helix domain-containing protein [Caulobacteraceae bacterium]|nr:helix-turn-helix domain-containing protein [Caulobacteraceae bacterium]
MLLQDASVGQRLAHRRYELGHRIVDAAGLGGVDTKTWMGWEREEHAPTVQHYPALIRYLGSEPWAVPDTLGDRLLAQRRRLGLSIKRAAIISGVDEGTFRRWERGDWKPQPRSLSLIEAFLERAEI